MKHTFLLLVFTLFVIVSKAQTYQAHSKVLIPADRKVIRVDKALYNKFIDSGFVIKKQYNFNDDEATFTAIKIDTIHKKDSILVYKNIKTDITPFGGWANLSSDDNDKSIIHLNYWLNDKYKINQGEKVDFYYREIMGDGTFSDWEDTTYNRKNKIFIMPRDSILYLMKYDSKCMDDCISKMNWFKTSTTKIVVYKDSTSDSIDYYLVDKYDRNADYIITLQNREFISFKSRSWDFGPIIIPFKYRFGFKKNSISIDPEFQADINLGIFTGRTWGRFRKGYTNNQLTDLSRCEITWGGFITFSTTSLDSLATTAGKNPFLKDKTATLGVVSVGTGAMGTLYNFQLGLFLGIDNGVGINTKNWNFNNKLWVGLGIGYDLKKLFFK